MATRKKAGVSARSRGKGMAVRQIKPAKLRAMKLERKGLGEIKLKKIRAQNRIRATTTGTRVFDRSLHKTNIWLKDVMECLDWSNRERAYGMLRATLQSLRDQLFTDEMAQLGAQLPILLRGVYYEGWNPRKERERLRKISEFLDIVRAHLGPAGLKMNDEAVEKGVRACLGVISRHIGAGEMDEIRGILPSAIKPLVSISEPAEPMAA